MRSFVPGARRGRWCRPRASGWKRGRVQAGGVFGGSDLDAALLRAERLAEVEDPGREPYAALLVQGGEPSTSGREATVQGLGARYVDESLLKALDAMPFIKQVVLFGSNLDTRPYWLAVPRGTILFDVCPQALHDHKRERLKGHKTRPGCLHVRTQG